MEVGKWKMAQRWRHFKRPASSKGMWKEFVKDQARLYEPIPSFVVPEFDELSPKEERYYQQGPFSTDEVFLGSKGGVPQLVQPGPGRQGYQGAHDKGAGERLREEITEASNKKYADILKEKNIKGKYTDITDAKVKSKIRSLYHTREVNPYKKIGFPRSKELIESNFKNFNKFLKSGQTLDDFYDLFKNPTFKLNLRAYLKGEAGTGITGAFDDLNFKTKYKKIIPKITEYLEVWHDYEQNPNKKFKTQRKKELVKKWSDLHTENMISKAKRVKKDDYANQLDLAHRQDLIIDQNISELGIERPEINRVLIKDAELERNKLHRKNFALVDEIKKGNNVEKNLRLIKDNNARITKIAEITKGRLTGITINPDTLEAVKLKPSNVVAADAGILNKSIKNLSPDDKKILRTQILPQMIEEARAMTPEKIASELSGIMDDPVLSKKLAARMKNLKAGKQITKPVFEKSHEVYKFLKDAGFSINKCLIPKKQGGGVINPDQCITGVIQETAEEAKKGNKAAQDSFKKSGSRLGLLFGWLDVPLEISFAAPHLLMGDVEAAKRATTFGLTGWGKVDLDNVDDPEARKYLKHRRDTEDWIKNWEKHYHYSEKLKNLPANASDAYRKQTEGAVEKFAGNMKSIQENYEGYDRSGSENEDWAYNPEEMAGKRAAKNWIDTKVETDLDKQLAKTHGLHGDPFLLDLASPYADVEKEKLRASPKDLESFIETKGQDFWGDPEGWWFYRPLKQEEAEAHGVGNIYDDYYMGASEGKDIRDSYSSIPLDYASQLGALEAKETREGLKRARYNPLSEMYYNKGGRVSYLDGGIVSLLKK